MTTRAQGPSVPNVRTPTVFPVQPDPRDVLYTRFLGPLAADKYALTMASALFEAEAAGYGQGLFEAETSFQMFVRKLPKTGQVTSEGQETRSSYMLTAGLPFLTSWMEGWSFSPGDIATLKRQKDSEGNRTFSDRFLNKLQGSRLNLDVDAMPDGSLAFPHEPMLRIKGPFWQCLMVEAMTLNVMNSCTNYATLTSQAVAAAEGRPVWEFGFRRSQDMGGMAPAYAAYVGGAAGSSNMLADKFLGVPSAGTMAHALVMVNEDEISAFRMWAKGAPGLGMFLVDTYDTLQGVKNAVKVCKEEGVKLQGVRLDSGNLAELAKESRQILDAAGFKDAKIFASNDLDPAKITNLVQKEQAPIDAFGVGTWVASAASNPALGGVYKLAQINRGNAVRNVMKFSEDAGKSTLPGLQDVIRFLGDDGKYAGDVLVAANSAPSGNTLMRDMAAATRENGLDIRVFNAGARFVKPMQPLLRDGVLVAPLPDATQSRSHAALEVSRLAPAQRHLTNPQPYRADVEVGLHQAWQGAVASNNKRRTQKARPAQPAFSN